MLLGDNLSAFIFNDEVGEFAAPVGAAGVSDGSRHFELRRVGTEIRDGINRNTLDKNWWSNEQPDRAVNAAIVCPVARLVPGKHGIAKGVVDLDGDRVGRFPVQERRDVERECGISLADVLTGGLAVHPHGGRVEHRFKFDALRPGRPGFERAPVPGGAVVFFRAGHDLPGVGNGDADPIRRSQLRLVPAAGFSTAWWVSPKPPLAFERDLMVKTSATCFTS